MKSQAEVIAEIALAIEFCLPDTKGMTRNIFAALNKAYRAGFEASTQAAIEQRAQFDELITKVIG